MAGELMPSSRDGEPSEREGRTDPPMTACFSCRSARQKCNKRTPCSRCAAHQIDCRYPEKSHRGRKKGSINKPATLQKILSRIWQHGLEDELSALLLRRQTDEPATKAAEEHVSQQTMSDISQCSSTAGLSPMTQNSPATLTRRHDNATSHGELQSVGDRVTAESLVEAEYSPLNVLATAVDTETLRLNGGDKNLGSAGITTTSSSQGGPYRQTQLKFQANRANLFAHSRLSKYFANRETDLQDWDVLAKANPDCTFRLDLDSCDPTAAGLIGEPDVVEYFRWFFQIRNPLVGLLDANLHSPEYVHSRSFTLFSVICALGSELSSRPKDKLMSPLLYSIAERNIKWAILNAVKSLEVIQAIIDFTYWAHVSESHAQDPSWLRFGHALSIAREMRIYQPTQVSKKIGFQVDPDVKERQQRNYQRTWLFLFIMDKSFGITLGRPPCISWREIPADMTKWWQAKTATSSDRITTGIAQARASVMKDLEAFQPLDKTPISVVEWHRQATSKLDEFRSCDSENAPWADQLSIMTFYIEYNLLLLHNHAQKELTSLEDATPDQLNHLSHQTFLTSFQVLQLVANDAALASRSAGFHNTQLVMISHAATELMRASQTASVPDEMKRQAAANIRGAARCIQKAASELPNTAFASLYLEYIQFLIRKLEPNGSRSSQAFPLPSNHLEVHLSANMNYLGTSHQRPEDTIAIPFAGYWDVDGNLAGAEDFSFGSQFGLDPLGLTVDPAMSQQDFGW
ncbi:hypothetical protein GQ53DRAFT_128697 [Thozetella sp. PMI_491]|nr:hypothetical protein GQ53DRAFT_128697 [Thozetella sp. PMI_491]